MAKNKVAKNPLFIIILATATIMIWVPKWVWGLLLVCAITAAIMGFVKIRHKNKSSELKNQLEISTASPMITVNHTLKNPGKNASMNDNQPTHKTPAQIAPSKMPKPLSSTITEEEEFASFSLSGNTETSSYKIPPSPKADAISADYRWIPLGQTVWIAGFEVKGGMIYVGTGIKAIYGQADPALVDPSLKVAQKSSVNIAERLTSYWPSYAEMSPDARRAYLQWLSSGRADPSADIGYVFLFFYGLERRILIDGKDDPATLAEIPVIQAEIIRLLGIYAENASFKGYASNLLNYIDATLASTSQAYDNFLEEIVAENAYELPLKLKIGLGKLVVAEKPIPANWALAWVISDPNISKRTPVSRCQSLFSQLFLEKYQQTYNSGLILRQNKTRLTFSYWPASNGLKGLNFQQKWNDLPDVTAVKTPISKLQDLVDQCTVVLEPYSRFTGRNPDKAASLECLLLLPVHLWPYHVQHLIRRIKREIQAQPELIVLADLLSLFGHMEGLSRDRQLAFSQMFQKQGIGMEPDIALNAKTLKPDDMLALFAMAEPVESLLNNTGYQMAALSVDLACMLAHADGDFSRQEELFIQQHIDSFMDFSSSVKARLKARLALSFEQPLSLSTLKKQLESLTPTDRYVLAKLLVQLVQVDGVIAPAEIRFLERTYKALGLDTKQLYSDVHAGERVNGQSPPTSSLPTSNLVNLDIARINQLRQETAAVTALLSNVFSEEEIIKPQKDTPEAVEQAIDTDETTSSKVTILGLDNEHSAFLRLMLTRSSWSMEELAQAAADMELMLEGALEQINEAVFDACDAPLIDGDDPVEINQDILKELTL